MKLSTFFLLDRAPSLSSTDPLTTAIDGCIAAERAGLDGVWIAEHHFRDFGGMPNPAVFLAHLAARTKRIRLGPAVSVLPFRDPIVVAEDYALVDRLSDGRLIMGVGSGSLDFELQGFGVDPARKRDLFDGALEKLLELWSPTAELNVRPVSTPPVHVATNKADAAREIGRRGLALLTLCSPEVESLDEIADRLSEHRRGLEEKGHDPEWAPAGVMLFGLVAESSEDALTVARHHFRAFGSNHGMADPDAIFDSLQCRGTASFGDPHAASAVLGNLEEMGASEVILWSSFGAMPIAALERSFSCLARDVRPALGRARQRKRLAGQQSSR